MSLAIDIDRVLEVLLADGWHKVDQRGPTSTFGFDAYEFIFWGSDKRRDENRPVATFQPENDVTGFSFREDGVSICGPMSSILAVRENEEEVDE